MRGYSRYRSYPICIVMVSRLEAWGLSMSYLAAEQRIRKYTNIMIIIDNGPILGYRGKLLLSCVIAK